MPSKIVKQKNAKGFPHRLFPNQSAQDDICHVVSDQNTKIVSWPTELKRADLMHFP